MDSPLAPEKDQKTGRRGLMAGLLAGSVALHLLAAALAGVWVVVRHLAKAPPPPAPAPAVAMRPPPPPEPERSLLPSSGGGAAAAAVRGKIQSLTPAKMPLPELPRMPATPGSSALLSPDLFARSLGALEQISIAGAVDGEAFGLADHRKGNGVSFLGVQTSAKRVVLMYDISRTVSGAAARAGMPMERIREETARLIGNLGVNTRFTLVQFARNYAFFRPELVPSTKANQEAAKHWLERYFATTGSFPRSVPGAVGGSPGFLVVLEEVFRMRPDAVFVLSDGSMQRGTSGNATIPVEEIQARLSALQAGQAPPANIFFIGVGVAPETEKALRKALSVAGGRGGYSSLRP